MKLTEYVTERELNTRVQLILSCFLLVTMALVISPVGQENKIFKWNNIENCKKKESFREFISLYLSKYENAQVLTKIFEQKT